jgi:benzylsuccinate CoA-transferase BbsF subunit
MGTHAYHAPPFRLSKTPHRMERPAPRMGEHTEWVCRELLGMDDETFQALQSEGVFM